MGTLYICSNVTLETQVQQFKGLLQNTHWYSRSRGHIKYCTYTKYIYIQLRGHIRILTLQVHMQLRDHFWTHTGTQAQQSDQNIMYGLQKHRGHSSSQFYKTGTLLQGFISLHASAAIHRYIQDTYRYWRSGITLRYTRVQQLSDHIKIHTGTAAQGAHQNAQMSICFTCTSYYLKRDLF